jgi:hypothetical protein
VGKDDDGDAIGLEDPVDFAEGLGQHLFKAPPGLLYPASSVGVCYHFLRFGGERRGEEVRVKVANRPLEPDVKEVRESRIVHVIVIRRVGYDGVKEVVRVWKFGSRALLNLGQILHRRNAGEVGENKVYPFLHIWPSHIRKRVDFNIIPHHWQRLATKDMLNLFTYHVVNYQVRIFVR